MKIVKINQANLEEQIQETAQLIKKGGAVIYPTDTVYGLGVNALNEKAIERLIKIKGRSDGKPIPIMIKDIEMAGRMAYLSPRIEKILKAIWPGPVTAVFNKREILPDILTANQKTIGLRIPDHQIAQSLANQLDFPLTATSANLSGQPASGQIKEVIEQFKGNLAQPDLILDVGDLPPSQPSTVIDLKGSQLRILRVGPVTKEGLLKMLEIK